MDPLKLVRIMGFVFIAILVVNFLLLIFKVITFLTFWINVILIALIAYQVIPRLRKKFSKA